MSPRPHPTLEPQDRHNQRLEELTHPAGRPNPEPPEGGYQLVVVGAGTAGLVTAAGAAGLGARVALVEARHLGGDCLVAGCVPSKALLRAARAWKEARTAEERFGGPAVAEGDAGRGDFAAVMERMRRLRSEIAVADSVERFEGLGVDVYLGRGRFVSEDTLEVVPPGSSDGGGSDGESSASAGAPHGPPHRLTFQRAVIATGGRPFVPPIPGLDAIRPLTNESLFELTELPERLAVVGGGPIGCEMAQAFARFGSRVTLLEGGPQLLPKDPADAAALVERALTADGVEVRLGARVRRFEPLGEDPGDGIRVTFGPPEGGDEDEEGESSGPSGDAVVVDRVLLAVGRRPNTEGLGLEAAGVAFDEETGVEVDDRLQTTQGKIFAAGDVASRYRFTHAADALARIAIQNALFYGRARASDLVIPWCTYTSPEVAHVGRTAEELLDAGTPADVLTVPLEENDRARLDGESEGFLRLLVEPGGDRILGASLVAEHAGELIGQLCLAITEDIGLEAIASVVYPYPTQGEVLKKAADTWRRGKLTPLVRKALDLRFRFLG